jgi:hypothetical protein
MRIFMRVEYFHRTFLRRNYVKERDHWAVTANYNTFIFQRTLFRSLSNYLGNTPNNITISLTFEQRRQITEEMLRRWSST